MSKAILLIDLDGVSCDWIKAVREAFNNKFPDRKFLPDAQLTEFYCENLHPEEWRKDITAITKSVGFYANLEPITGALEVLKDIEENCLDFIEPFLCSSPEVDYEEQLCHTEKAAWVERNLGRFWTKRLILTKDKTLVRGHFLIDDKPNITGALPPTWNQLIFKQPWNKSYRTAESAGGIDLGFDWSDWQSFKNEVLIPSFKEKRIITSQESGIILLNQ